MLDTRELAWAAGLFEGEGCISLKTHRAGTYRLLTTRRYLHLTVKMGDRDSVDRFHRAIGGLGAVYRQSDGMWSWQTGKFEHGQAVIAMLWYGFGERRRNRCVEVLEMCRNDHV
jgi:hypothetical protein